MRLRGLAVVLMLAPAVAAADPIAERDATMLRDAGLSPEPSHLLAFFADRTVSPAAQQKLAGLVKQLGDDNFTIRETASRDLIASGRAAVPLLRSAAAGSDLEVVRRAERCLSAIAARPEIGLAPAVARRLVASRPEGGVKVLLAYVSAADDELAREAVVQALTDLALRDGRLDENLTGAVKDREPVIRAAAAFALGRSGAEGRRLVRPLLSDAETIVRFEAARVLIESGEREALAVLVDLLRDAPPLIAWRAEDLLRELAGDAAPGLTLVAEAESRAEAVDAWKSWRKHDGDKLDLTSRRLTGLGRGGTVIAELDGPGNAGRVWECGPDGKPRWRIDPLKGPIDVQILPNGRLLIAEHGEPRVTERDRLGAVLWEVPLEDRPVSCQRLADGNTFIATARNLTIISPAGKELSRVRAVFPVWGAERLADGRLIYVHGRCHVIGADAAGREEFAVSVGDVRTGGGVQRLGGDRLLVSQPDAGRVAEIDIAGRVLWEATVEGAAWARRLADGHTLVACPDARRVVELDAEGKIVWRKETTGRPFRVRRP